MLAPVVSVQLMEECKLTEVCCIFGSRVRRWAFDASSPAVHLPSPCRNSSLRFPALPVAHVVGRAAPHSAVCAIASVVSFWLPLETAGMELVDTIPSNSMAHELTVPTSAIDIARSQHGFRHLEEEVA
jgi:hypothetical protein